MIDAYELRLWSDDGECDWHVLLANDYATGALTLVPYPHGCERVLASLRREFAGGACRGRDWAAFYIGAYPTVTDALNEARDDGRAWE